MPGCSAVVDALEALRDQPNPSVKAIQDWVKES
jgi:hypothetical protein